MIDFRLSDCEVYQFYGSSIARLGLNLVRGTGQIWPPLQSHSFDGSPLALTRSV